SPRFVLNHLSLNEISEIKHQGKVGVFVNETVEKIVEITAKGKLNYIQLHGDENESFISELREKLNTEIKIIKVIRISSITLNKTKWSEESLRFLVPRKSEGFDVVNDIDYVLFDTDSKAFGGTGKTFDWNILNEIEIPKPYFLSGGISSENIHQLSAINQKPFALDINSKFEIEQGKKDLEKIKNFIKIKNYEF
ncbi:phosphoribosylanthranilate isomerase, partial [Kaistella sp.]|uniref:phosphoribosylanthranilate isomerase n=1 Tax=Kaistella sp. TaxID=2782235 RepID=UPI003C3CFBF7